MDGAGNRMSNSPQVGDGSSDLSHTERPLGVGM